MIYFLKRLLLTIPMLLGITFITYGAICLAPGGPAAGLMQDFNPKISDEYRQKLIAHFHYDKPFYLQYAHWLSRIVRGDWGESLKDNQPVLKKIFEALPRTLLLTGLSLLLILALAIPIGVFSAVSQNSFWDRLLTVVVFMGFSVPTYWVALLLMIFFGIHLGWTPVTGFRSLFAEEWPMWRQVLDIAHHLILPVGVMAITGLASLSRYIRNGMLDVLRQDYIRAARAKGLPESTVVWSHAFRNTMIPVITLLGFSLPELISAGVIFETIFSYPGLGRLAYEAVMTRDTFLIMPTVTMSAFLTLLGNLIADLLYAWADPRIRVR